MLILLKRLNVTSNSKENKRLEIINDWLPLIIFIVAIIAFLAPIIVFAISKCLNLEYGSLGDVIAGATAPIIGLFAAILVYLSFRAQIEANKIVREESNFRYLNDEFVSIRNAFDTFICITPPKVINVIPSKGNGFFAIKEVSDFVFDYYKIEERQVDFIPPTKSEWNFEPSILKMDYLFQNFSVFINEVRKANISFDNRRIIESRIWLFYAEHLHAIFDTIEKWDIHTFDASYETKTQRAGNMRAMISGLMGRIAPFEETFHKNN